MSSSAGVVTLLFTDLVASTELLARVGDDAAEKLRRVHFGLLRNAISTGGGQEVKTLGLDSPEITVVPVERLERIASSGKLKRFIPLGAKG